MYDEMSWKQVNTVKRFTVGNVLDSNGAYSLFVFNEGTASEFRGWVSAQYAAPLIN